MFLRFDSINIVGQALIITIVRQIYMAISAADAVVVRFVPVCGRIRRDMTPNNDFLECRKLALICPWSQLSSAVKHIIA